MCGIFGFVSPQPFNFDFRGCTDNLVHRGPDDKGYFQGNKAVLGHRRLSIIDLSGGKQPIFNEDCSRCIIFNGEIYNYQELRAELIAKGHLFATRSDTETILHAYEEWGEACVERLRGMFAFAIWNSLEHKLFLARDRVGIKPLFFHEGNNILAFASEMKAILAVPGISRDMDPAAVAAYFELSYIPSPLTVFKSIRKLSPGHTLTWEKGRIRVRRYWDLRFEPDHSLSEGDFIQQFNELMEDAVRMRLMSEVPLGAFLSGGIDSSLVTAMMSRSSPEPVNTFTIGFGGDVGGYLDERRYARMVADRYATNHLEYEVMPTPGDLINQIVKAFDEPFADDSTIPSYYVCKIAREKVTVTLSGLGGDEAFAGYERYLGFHLRGFYRRLPGVIGRSMIPSIVNRLPERSDGHYTINHMKRFLRSAHSDPAEAYVDYLSVLKPGYRDRLFNDARLYSEHLQACRENMMAHFRSDNVCEDAHSLNRALYCDIKTYLPEDILAVTDRMSMQHSLEVRVPFADHKVLELCARVPAAMRMRRFTKKYLLKRAVRGVLPREVVHHRKQGFVGPMAQWLKTDLKNYVRACLAPERLRRHDVLNPATVKKVLDEHFSQKEIHDTLIWAMVIFQNWFEHYIEGSSDDEKPRNVSGRPSQESA